MASRKMPAPDSVIPLERQSEQFRSARTGRVKLPKTRGTCADTAVKKILAF